MPLQRFRVKTATIATTRMGDRMVAVHLPARAEITLIDELPMSSPRGYEQVSVEWDSRRYQMFVVDLLEKCERVSGASRSNP